MASRMHGPWTAFALGLLLAACGGGGGGGGSGGSGNGDDGGATVDEPAGPAVAGFDFRLARGDFWTYRWDYYERTGSQGSSDTIDEDDGRFWVVLGAARTIEGVVAREVEVYGKSRALAAEDFAPRWRYLALADHRLLGSEDGVTLEPTLDAASGQWPGGGFFTAFPDDRLITAEPGTLSNDYIHTAAIRAGRSHEESRCEYFPGIGTICGGDVDQTLTEDEYYLPEVGPAGYGYENSYSDCGGGFCSWGEWDHHLGLVASSFTGDSLPFVDETTAGNDVPADAQPIGITAVVRGDVHASDGGSYHTVSIGGQLYRTKLEDWYRIDVGAGVSVTITLGFERAPGSSTDLDLFLFDAGASSLVAYSIDDNAGTGIHNETLTATLSAGGSYHVVVDAWATPDGRAPYTMQIE